MEPSDLVDHIRSGPTKLTLDNLRCSVAQLALERPIPYLRQTRSHFNDISGQCNPARPFEIFDVDHASKWVSQKTTGSFLARRLGVSETWFFSRL